MQIFDDYLKPIREAIAADPKSGKLHETYLFRNAAFKKANQEQLFENSIAHEL